MEINDEYIISIFFTNHSKPYLLRKSYNSLISNNESIKEYISNRYNDSESIKETLYRIKANIEQRPVCLICGKPVKFLRDIVDGSHYAKTCCTKCQSMYRNKKAKETKLLKYGDVNYNNRLKCKETVLSKYGCENVMLIQSVKEKIILTNLRKYGCKWSAQNKEINKKTIDTLIEKYGGVFNPEKVKETNMEKYNCEYPFQSSDIQEKCKQTEIKKYGSLDNFYKLKDSLIQETMILRYGVPFYVLTDEHKEKVKETCLEKYGTESYFGSDNFRSSIKNIFIQKYGVDNPMKVDEVKEKSKETCLEKYGTEHYSQTQMFKERLQEINEERVHKIYLTKKKNHSFKISKPEQIVKELLENKLGVDDVKYQYKSLLYPYACDFYITSLNLYIECNFFWTHGKHRFDENNIDDIELLNIWKQKGFSNAVHTWTIRDINKFKCAEENNLNYKAFYSLQECKQYIENEL